MTITKTPRLGLILESDDETIDPFALNWPILDSFAGGKTVSNGVTPPNDQLYDGMILAEYISGKSWIARKNPTTGLFTKSWLVYPWLIEAFNSTYTTIASTNGGPAVTCPVDSLTIANGVNASAADIVAGAIVAPIDALYEIVYEGRWNNVANTGQKSTYVSTNGDSNYETSETLRDSGLNFSVNAGTLHVKLVAGDKINLKSWQNSGGSQGCKASITMGVISPL